MSLRRPICYVLNSTTDIFMNNVVIRDLPMSGKQKYYYDTNTSMNFRILCPERLTLVWEISYTPESFFIFPLFHKIRHIYIFSLFLSIYKTFSHTVLVVILFFHSSSVHLLLIFIRNFAITFWQNRSYWCHPCNVARSILQGT